VHDLLVLLHPDFGALGALPLSLSVIDVPLELLHPDSAPLTRHVHPSIAPMSASPRGRAAVLVSVPSRRHACSSPAPGALLADAAQARSGGVARSRFCAQTQPAAEATRRRSETCVRTSPVLRARPRRASPTPVSRARAHVAPLVLFAGARTPSPTLRTRVAAATWCVSLFLAQTRNPRSHLAGFPCLPTPRPPDSRPRCDVSPRGAAPVLALPK
jgi:hypothetical protein